MNNLPPLPDAEVKKQLIKVAVERYRLSYVISNFSGEDRWDLKHYTMQRDEGGTISINDDDTEMDVVVYNNPPNKVWFEYQLMNGWHRFIPEEVLGQWRIGTAATWKDVPGGGWSGS